LNARAPGYQAAFFKAWATKIRSSGFPLFNAAAALLTSFQSALDVLLIFCGYWQLPK
jgi:hypothetical protein